MRLEEVMSAKPASQSEVILQILPLGFVWQTLDPFLFCVHHRDAYPRGNAHMGPDTSLAGRTIGQDFDHRDGWNMYHGARVPGFPPHPHRGFETVTIVREGLIDHADSLGAAARFGGGDVQWLTAGRGIIHSEMFPLLNRDGPNPAELFQIWLNLARASKLVAPHFSMMWSQVIPQAVFRDGAGRSTEVTIIAGQLDEHRAPPPPPSSWAAQADADVAIWTLKLEPGATWTLPPARAGSNRALYFFKGAQMKIAGREVQESHAVVVRADSEVLLENGDAPAELLVLQGRPLAEPVVQHGPFVMNTREEIQQAFVDYQRGTFGAWNWPSEEPVHAREESRLARHADGHIERPAR
jgi:redox-sensitive bicupin YhaK (pirin superfamily)